MLEFLGGVAVTDGTMATLAAILGEVSNARNVRQAEHGLRLWATESEQRLRFLLPRPEIERLVYTQRCRTVLANPTDSARDLASAELADAVHRWTDEVNSVTAARARWQGGHQLVGIDTNALVHSAYPPEETDWHTLLNIPPDTAIKIVLPMAVIDEVDRLKRNANQNTRTRARHCTRLLATLFDPNRTHTLDVWAPDAALTEDTTVAILLDPPPPYTRLPIVDDELVRRLATIKALANARVVLASEDWGTRLRASAAGLWPHVLEVKDG